MWKAGHGQSALHEVAQKASTKNWRKNVTCYVLSRMFREATLPWCPSPVEGHINRLTMPKRQCVAAHASIFAPPLVRGPSRAPDPGARPGCTGTGSRRAEAASPYVLPETEHDGERPEGDVRHAALGDRLCLRSRADMCTRERLSREGSTCSSPSRIYAASGLSLATITTMREGTQCSHCPSILAASHQGSAASAASSFRPPTPGKPIRFED